MKPILLIFACLVLNVTVAQEKTTTIYLIRHAEKADASADPSLSTAGIERAQKWGKYFDDKNISTYYVSRYKRTKMTALEITSTFSKMPEPGTERNFNLRTYDPATLSLKDVANDNKGQNVLIVGHSNTIPTQINALIGEKKYAEIPESDFGNLYIIKVTGDKITHELVKM